MKPLKIGIIGTGNIVTTAHLPAYVELGDRVEVTAIAGIEPESLNQVAQTFKIPHTYHNYQDMLNHETLDLISVCTPNFLHAKATMDALGAGCHVFCEKPPAMTVEEIERVKQEAGKSGKKVSYNFHHRFNPQAQAVKSFVKQNELGTIYSAKVEAIRRRGIPGWGNFTSRKVQGGGALIDIGIHMVDLALDMMDFPEPDTILGVTHDHIGKRGGIGLMGDWDPKAFDVEDYAMAMVTFKNGASMVLETAFAMNMAEKSRMNIELRGTEGGASVYPPVIYGEKNGQLTDTNLPFSLYENRYTASITSFVDAIQLNKEPHITLDQAVTVQTILNSIYQSANEGRAIKL